VGLNERTAERDEVKGVPPAKIAGLAEIYFAAEKTERYVPDPFWNEVMSVSILIVDDEPDVAELFRQRFRREARQGTYVLHFATSGEAALELLADGIEPQLIVILSDINMPGMDGLTLLQEIKRVRPDVPVMMVTAYGDDERRRRASESGAAEFITKPVDFDLLKRQLKQLASGAA
jgi:CheY-like chemotaxis protein